MPMEVINLKDYGLKNLKVLLWMYNQPFYKSELNLQHQSKAVTKYERP